MKIVVLAALIAAVSSGRLVPETSVDPAQPQGPWQVGKLYKYDVESHTLAYMPESASTGGSYRARFIIRAKPAGKLEARLENPEHALVHQQLKRHEPLPEELNYQPVLNLDKPFEINVEGGRVVSLSLPSGLTLAYENLLKGLIGALQVDLSTYRNIHSSYDTFDNENKQGQFRKMETDVTGDCETLYVVSPVASEWRRELPMFAKNEDPIEVTKSKSYGHCRHRVDYHYGVPEGAEWTGTAHSTKEDQLIKRATVSRYLMGKNGPIYKAETTSTVNVNPHMYGKQQAEVHSKISVQLVGWEDDNQPEWEKPEGGREIMNLLYSLTPKQVAIDDTSSSSESRESSESRVEQSSRVRRSAKPKNSIVAINKIIIKKRSEEDSSSQSSSSSDSDSSFVNDDVPKVNEPAYSALYMNPQPRGDKKQNPMNAQKLVQEMAQQLQNPNNMPKADFLTKFNILVRLISSMSYGQLTQTSRSIEIGKSSDDVMKADMWRIYRDAVAQSGTLPAFQLIRTWIQEKKIEREEAAEVVAVLPRTLRYPTKDAMIQFFDLALSPEVKDQMFLNTTALIAASKFIHMGQVDNRTAHQYYPTHMYGRLSNRHDRFVLDTILPRLSAELKTAIEQEDSHKAQVFIKSIGILGHREILNVFAPYLEGKVPASTFLRTQMVDSLRYLAREKDRYVRAALYSILRNTAEPYEVRVAAVQNIFMTHPTSAMWQAMAEMTKNDPSVEVRAVIKSGIEYAAELRHPRYFELARSAQAVKDMVTSEEFGAEYSTKAMRSYDRDDDVGVLGVWSSIGGDDSLLPKSSRYSWNSRISGWFKESTISTTWSSWQPFINFYREFINKVTRQTKSQASHKYSADKIYNMFNNKYENEKRQPAEASFYLDLMNQQRLFALSEEDIKQWPQQWKNLLMDFSNGMEGHYTKVLNKNQVSIMFPLASGMPFIFKYKQPAVIHVQTKTNGLASFLNNGDFNNKMDHEIILTYAENHDGSVGFLDTISNQWAGVGVVGKIQVNLPFKIQYEMKSGEFKFIVSPLLPDQDTNVLHYSIWPYSASQKKDSLVPISQDPSTKLINRDSKTIAVDYKFGQQIGVQFQLNGYSYSNDYRNVINMFLKRDPLSYIVAPFNQVDLAQTHFNLRYLGKQSKSKSMIITAAVDTVYNQKVEGQLPAVAADISDTTPNSPARRDAILKQIVAGINKARAYVLDLSASFDGAQKLEYVMTSAISSSEVDPKVHFAVFAGRNSEQFGNWQINTVGKLNRPISTTFNYAEALKQEFKMPFEADIRYGPKENIHIQATAERSAKYLEELQRYYLSQQCLEEIASNNYYQPACHEMLIRAQTPDTYRFSVSYNVNPTVRNAAYQVYRIVKSLALWQVEDNPLKPSPEGKLELMFDLSYLTKTMNMGVNSRYGELRIKNIALPWATYPVLSAYGPMTPLETALNHFTKNQYQPYCSVDGSRVRTFSNRRYNYSVSRSWHVVYSSKADNYDDYVVLVRRPTPKTQEVYISYRAQNGNDLEIEIKPSAEGSSNYNVEVATNSKKVSEGDFTTYWDEKDASPLLEYFVQHDGVLMIYVKRDRLRIMYDAQRLVVLPTEGRGNSRGICGFMTGDPRDDYMTPYGLVDTPEHFAASYALNDENSEPKTQQWQAQAKQRAYWPQNRYTSILRSDASWQSAMQSDASEDKWDDSNVYVSRSYLKKKGACKVQKQVQYYENYAEICITTKPMPACQSNCNAEGFKIQAAQVVCRPKLDQQFITYRDQIRLGQNPKVSGVPQARQYRVPSTCTVQA
ncbi:unnamed protein product [Colias eurytheme]|nr:unnamed protein product [Colias eurytheme]